MTPVGRADSELALHSGKIPNRTNNIAASCIRTRG